MIKNDNLTFYAKISHIVFSQIIAANICIFSNVVLICKNYCVRE